MRSIVQVPTSYWYTAVVTLTRDRQLQLRFVSHAPWSLAPRPTQDENYTTSKEACNFWLCTHVFAFTSGMVVGILLLPYTVLHLVEVMHASITQASQASTTQAPSKHQASKLRGPTTVQQHAIVNLRVNRLVWCFRSICARNDGAHHKLKLSELGMLRNVKTEKRAKKRAKKSASVLNLSSCVPHSATALDLFGIM